MWDGRTVSRDLHTTRNPHGTGCTHTTHANHLANEKVNARTPVPTDILIAAGPTLYYELKHTSKPPTAKPASIDPGPDTQRSPFRPHELRHTCLVRSCAGLGAMGSVVGEPREVTRGTFASGPAVGETSLRSSRGCRQVPASMLKQPAGGAGCLGTGSGRWRPPHEEE